MLESRPCACSCGWSDGEALCLWARLCGCWLRWLLCIEPKLSWRLGRGREFYSISFTCTDKVTSAARTLCCCSETFLPSFSFSSFTFVIYLKKKTNNTEDLQLNTEGLWVKHSKWDTDPTFTVLWAVASHLISFQLQRTPTNLSNIHKIFSILQHSVPEIRCFCVSTTNASAPVPVSSLSLS